MRDLEKTRKTVFKLRSFFIFKRSYKLFKMDITKKGQILLFPPPQLTEYFVLLSPSEEIKKETTKLKKKLYKMIGRETENSKSVAHISLFKTKWEHDKHVLERVSVDGFLSGRVFRAEYPDTGRVQPVETGLAAQ